jgi:hypothetical protein
MVGSVAMDSREVVSESSRFRQSLVSACAQSQSVPRRPRFTRDLIQTCFRAPAEGGNELMLPRCRDAMLHTRRARPAFRKRARSCGCRLVENLQGLARPQGSISCPKRSGLKRKVLSDRPTRAARLRGGRSGFSLQRARVVSRSSTEGIPAWCAEIRYCRGSVHSNTPRSSNALSASDRMGLSSCGGQPKRQRCATGQRTVDVRSQFGELRAAHADAATRAVGVSASANQTKGRPFHHPSPRTAHYALSRTKRADRGRLCKRARLIQER